MGRVSSRRIIWMVLVAVLASGAGVALSLREAPPPVPNLGARGDREEIMRLALSTLRPFGDLYIPSLPLPADEHGDREAEPMSPSGPAHGDSAGMGENARKGIGREFRLADATLAVCSQDVSQPHCMQDISLAEQLDIPVPRELWSQWLQVNATQSQVPGSVGQGIKRIAAEDVPGYFALPGGCFPDKARPGFDVVWLGQPVFSVDGNDAVMVAQLDGFQLPAHVTYLTLLQREEGAWKVVQSGDARSNWNTPTRLCL